MAKELEKPGVDNVGEWWLVSTLGTGTLFRRSNEGPMFRRSAILKVCYCDCDLICMARAANLWPILYRTARYFYNLSG